MIAKASPANPDDANLIFNHKQKLSDRTQVNERRTDCMTQPDALKSDSPLQWSTGTGTDVWALFRACIDGDLETVKSLLEKEPSLGRCHYRYRKPLYFAVRENRIEVAAFLLER